MRKIYTNDQLIDELKRIGDKLNHPPSYEDMRTNSSVHPATIQRHFSGWAYALRAAGFVDLISQWTPDRLNPADGGWLAGLVAGEGCFRIARPSPRSGNGLSHSYSPVFIVQLRADDMAALETMRQLWSIDNPVTYWSRDLDRSKGIDAGDGARFSVRDVPTLHYKIIATFQRYPLRARKQADFEIFAEAVNMLHRRHAEGRANLHYTDMERSQLEHYYLELRDIKKYQKPQVA